MTPPKKPTRATTCARSQPKAHAVGRWGEDLAARILEGVDGISFTRFAAQDVVRHPLVQRIVEAYAAAEQPTDHPTT